MGSLDSLIPGPVSSWVAAVAVAVGWQQRKGQRQRHLKNTPTQVTPSLHAAPLAHTPNLNALRPRRLLADTDIAYTVKPVWESYLAYIKGVQADGSWQSASA